MKNVFYFCLCLLMSSATYSGEWYEDTVTEDGEYFYYVGVSSKKKSKKEALEDAYADALKEAVRHNFGVMHNYVGQYAQSENDLHIRQNTLLYRSGVKIVGAVPMDKKLIEDDDLYIAYRKVRYPKREIAAEKMRLKNVKEQEYTVRPVEMPKINAPKKVDKEDDEEESSFSWSPSYSRKRQLPRYSWVYNPLFGGDEKDEFIDIPLKIEFYLWKHLSLGFAYYSDSDEYEEDYDASKNDYSQGYYYSNSQETITEDTSDFVVDLKLYPIRTKWFSVGIGAEYISGKKVVYRGDPDYQQNIEKESKFETTGTNITARFTLREYIEDEQTGISLYSDLREYNDIKVYSLGFSFDY